MLTEQQGRVLLVTLNRPKALNALNTQLSHELIDALTKADSEDGVGCIVVTGSAKAFAAGADIKEMQNQTYTDMHGSDFFGQWDALATLRKPTIAAVSGYALGGGCELAMMCDFIRCSDTAKFGQPEIKLGVMPGMGGSQRLTRLVEQAKAMEMCFTGRMMDAEEAERAGLVSRVIPTDNLLEETLNTAETIAGRSLPALMNIRDAIRRTQEVPLTEGVRFERRVFHALFDTADQKEGMAAFVEKESQDLHKDSFWATPACHMKSAVGRCLRLFIASWRRGLLGMYPFETHRITSFATSSLWTKQWRHRLRRCRRDHLALLREQWLSTKAASSCG